MCPDSEFPYPVRHLWCSTAVSWRSDGNIHVDEQQQQQGQNRNKYRLLHPDKKLPWIPPQIEQRISFQLCTIFASSIFFWRCLPILFPSLSCHQVPLELSLWNPPAQGGPLLVINGVVTTQKWLYKWVTGIITTHKSGVITLLISTT